MDNIISIYYRCFDAKYHFKDKIPLIVVELFNIVTRDTFNDDLHNVMLFSVVFPEIFKVEMSVEGLFKLTIDGRFNIAL